MKRNTFLIIVFFSMATLAAQAQPFTPTPEFQHLAMQSQLIMQNGQNYQGTIYEPFDNTAPSDQSGYGPNRAKGKPGVRKDTGDDWNPDDFILGPDTPPGQQYPIGEPWVLAAFAMVFAAVVWMKRRKGERMKG